MELFSSKMFPGNINIVVEVVRKVVTKLARCMICVHLGKDTQNGTLVMTAARMHACMHDNAKSHKESGRVLTPCLDTSCYHPLVRQVRKCLQRVPLVVCYFVIV